MLSLSQGSRWQLSNAPRVQWVRDDVAAIATAALRQIKRDADHHVIEERKAAPADTVYLISETMNGKEGQPSRVRVRVISGLPSHPDLSVVGADVDECLFELRHILLSVYHNQRMPTDTSEDIRNRVHRTSLVVSDGY